MDGYRFFVWPAFSITFLILGIQWLVAVRQAYKIRRKLYMKYSVSDNYFTCSRLTRASCPQTSARLSKQLSETLYRPEHEAN